MARYLQYPICVATAVLLAACGGPPPKKPPVLMQATLAVAADVNPDAAGRASPVVVRLFELKNLDAFGSADFFALSERGKETLGAELLATDEIVLRPGEQRRLERPLHDDTRFVAVVAAFRDLDRARWRASVPVRPPGPMPVTIHLGRRDISIAGK
jgi:type VI secretion system protein VasD